MTILSKQDLWKRTMKKLLLLDADVDIDSLMHVQNEAKEARLGIDPGELESIAYMRNAKEEVIFCTCDAAAIKLIAYMELDNRSISVEKALRDGGYRKRNLYPRHYQKTHERRIKEGKTLRVQFKKLT